MFNRNNKPSIFNKILSFPGQLIQFCINCFLQLTTSTERFFKKFSGGALKANEAIGKADSKILNFFVAIFRPIGSGVRFLGSIISGAFERLGFKSLFRRLRPFLIWLFYPLLALFGFFVTFTRTRKMGLLLWSIPIVILGATTFILLWQIQSNRGQMARSYRLAIDQAVASGAFEEAQLLRQKLIQLGARRDQLELQRVEELAETGQWEQAIAEAERISPVDEQGLGAGHFWLVSQYLQGRPESLPKATRLERAAKHLEHIKNISRSLVGQGAEVAPEIAYLEASLMIENGQIDKALEGLNSISDRFFPALILSIEVNTQLNRIPDAISNSIQLSDSLKRSPELGEQLVEPFFPVWCLLLSRSGEVERFRDGVRLWHSRFPENQAALAEWSKIQLQEIELLTRRGGENDLNRATTMLLEASSKFGLMQRELLSLWLLSKLPPQSNEPNFLSLASRAAASPSAAPILLEVLGTAAYLRKEPELAIELLERTIELDPANAVAYNNLAFILSSEFGDSKKSRALELAEKAAELIPESADIRETRGMLLIHFKEWERAIDDLTFVLANGPQKPEFHAALARAYRAIGKIEMASIHQSQAE